MTNPIEAFRTHPLRDREFLRDYGSIGKALVVLVHLIVFAFAYTTLGTRNESLTIALSFLLSLFTGGIIAECLCHAGSICKYGFDQKRFPILWLTVVCIFTSAATFGAFIETRETSLLGIPYHIGIYLIIGGFIGLIVTTEICWLQISKRTAFDEK